MAGSAQMARDYAGPGAFRRGFAPFFLSAGIFAGLVMPLWSIMQLWDVAVPSHLPGRVWHIHEMIFGYTAGIIAGFLLTAVPNWTGRLPVVGGRLAGLWVVWLVGRLALTFSEGFPLMAASLDSAFLVLFALVIFREVIAGKNKRNMPIALMVLLLALANIGFHVAVLGGVSTAVFERAALGLIGILISLIGGRVVPSFTRNWMVKQQMLPLPTGMGRLDMAVMGIGVVTIIAWIVAPDEKLTGGLFVIAAISFLARLARWRGWKTMAEPLVLVLHVGYLWMPVWFALMAVSIFWPDILDKASALHGLSAGAIGTMTMAMATRASLGHSGEPLTAKPTTSLIYVLLIIGAVLRIFAGWLPFDFDITVAAAGLLWAAGMVAFVVSFAPLLLGRR